MTGSALFPHLGKPRSIVKLSCRCGLFWTAQPPQKRRRPQSQPGLADHTALSVIQSPEDRGSRDRSATHSALMAERATKNIRGVAREISPPRCRENNQITAFTYSSNDWAGEVTKTRTRALKAQAQPPAFEGPKIGGAADIWANPQDSSSQPQLCIHQQKQSLPSFQYSGSRTTCRKCGRPACNLCRLDPTARTGICQYCK